MHEVVPDYYAATMVVAGDKLFNQLTRKPFCSLKGLPASG
jgi:hypothetical protein